MDALETVMLIKQAKDKGLNLGAAIEAAQRFRELNGSTGRRRLERRTPRALGPQSQAGRALRAASQFT